MYIYIYYNRISHFLAKHPRVDHPVGPTGSSKPIEIKHQEIPELKGKKSRKPCHQEMVKSRKKNWVQIIKTVIKEIKTIIKCTFYSFLMRDMVR